MLNHTYCGLVLTKNTQSSSNATGTFAWFVDFLDAFCQSLEDCHIGCEKCGFALRAALLRDGLQPDAAVVSTAQSLGETLRFRFGTVRAAGSHGEIKPGRDKSFLSQTQFA